MATIRKRRRKDGTFSFHVQVRLKGSPPQTASFSRKTDARRWVQDIESAIRDGRHFKASEAKRHTVAELIDRYIREEIPGKKDGANQKRQLLQWNERIGSHLLADVTPALIVEHRERLANEITVRGTPRSPATVNRYLAILSHAFAVASKEWGWIDDNPLRNVTKKKEPRGRMRYLTDAEREALLQACSQSECSYLYAIVVFALCTGARKGEILNLKWANIDSGRQIAVFLDTKNDERRSVAITGHLHDLIRDLEKIRRIDTDLVFPRRDGQKPVELRTNWQKAVSAANIENFRFHDLRHSAASYLAMNGATLSEIADILGHKTLTMVKRYAHLSGDHTAKVIESMNRKLFDSMSA